MTIVPLQSFVDARTTSNPTTFVATSAATLGVVVFGCVLFLSLFNTKQLQVLQDAARVQTEKSSFAVAARTAHKATIEFACAQLR